MKTSADKRFTRTREAVIAAFNSLVLGRRGPIRAADIIAHAKAGRSTFYDNFASAEEVHLEALARPYAVLADVAAGGGCERQLTGLLEHLWENRRRARETFDDLRLHERALRMLAGLTADRLTERASEFTLPLPLVAALAAQAAHAPIRGWIEGLACCKADALAHAIRAGCRGLIEGLRSSSRAGPTYGDGGSVSSPQTTAKLGLASPVSGSGART